LELLYEEAAHWTIALHEPAEKRVPGTGIQREFGKTVVLDDLAGNEHPTHQDVHDSGPLSS
jgi:hypothetical protein